MKKPVWSTKGRACNVSIAWKTHIEVNAPHFWTSEGSNKQPRSCPVCMHTTKSKDIPHIKCCSIYKNAICAWKGSLFNNRGQLLTFFLWDIRSLLLPKHYEVNAISNRKDDSGDWEFVYFKTKRTKGCWRFILAGNCGGSTYPAGHLSL